MNKKLLLVFFAVLLCVVVSVPAFADTAEDYTPHLIDNADLLTGEEESNLLAKLDEISDRLSVDVAVVTEDSIGDKTPREYADDFYDYNSYKYNPDGVLLLISMEERDWYITTTGSAITTITDARSTLGRSSFLMAKGSSRGPLAGSTETWRKPRLARCITSSEKSRFSRVKVPRT